MSQLLAKLIIAINGAQVDRRLTSAQLVANHEQRPTQHGTAVNHPLDGFVDPPHGSVQLMFVAVEPSIQ